MPKRGETLPFRVEFEFPPSERAPVGVKGVEVRHSVEEAATFADTLASRGASGRVVDRRDNRVLALFSAKPQRG